MTQQSTTKLLALVQERQCIQLEELLACFPELTWNQVFSLVDELSRQALICLQRRGFEYELRALS
jgi:Golgi nucleoside diphosphatase